MSDEVVDQNIPSNLFDVFSVTPLTQGTKLEHVVGADLVVVEPRRVSSIHRHNQAETVLYILSGSGQVIIGNETVNVSAGNRIQIRAGVFHGVRTQDESFTFMSIQSPPIAQASGHIDLEPIQEG
jgi:quercetin dioxygenase-like cupin family protein